MRWRRPLVLTSVLAIAALALLAAGCGGGGGSPGVATVASSPTTATTTTQSGLSALVAFSRCMRSHGVPNFPDPQHFAGGNVKLTIHNLAPSQAALNACGSLLPNRGGQDHVRVVTVERGADGQVGDRLGERAAVVSEGRAVGVRAEGIHGPRREIDPGPA